MEKICQKCGKEKPLTEFYNHKKSKDGKTSQCKKCMDDYHAQYAIAHAKELHEYRVRNKDRYAAHAKVYRTRHPERKAKASSEWHKGRRETNLAKMRQWAIDNKERKAISRHKWNKENPEKVKAAKLRRYGRKKNTVVTLTPEQIAFQRSKVCFFCGASKNLVIAHDIPVVAKGNTTLANTFCLCGKCNDHMHTHPLSEMITQLPLLPMSEEE